MTEARENPEVRENPSAGEDFHEETPEEFAAQPDREFTKVPPPGAGASPDDTTPKDATPDDTDEKRIGGAEPGDAEPDDDEDPAATGEK